MSHPIRSLLCSLVGSTALLLAGCCIRVPSDDDLLREQGKVLDASAKYLADYGTITMSTPLLTMPDKRFAFDLEKKGPDEYFADAKAERQAGVAFFQEISQILGVSLAAKVDMTQVASYAAALAKYRSDILRIQQKQGLQDDAAFSEYQAAVTAAANESDDTKRQKLLAEAKQAYADKFSAPEEAPTFPTGGTPDSTSGSAPVATEARTPLANSGTFSAPGKLSEGTQTTVSNRDAITRAAGDTITEAIFSVLGQPEKSAEFKDRTVLFGVSTVNVDPGRLTSRHCKAELTTRTYLVHRTARPAVLLEFLKRNPAITDELKWTLAENGGLDPTALKLKNKDGKVMTQKPNAADSTMAMPAKDAWLSLGDDDPGSKETALPLAVAVSPLTDALAIDSAASYRQRKEFAFLLALAYQQAGMTGSAETMLQRIEQNELDVGMSEYENDVTSYSVGGCFGYRVVPRLTNPLNTATGKVEPDRVLRRQTFPVLVILGFDTEDLQLKVGRDGDKLRLYEPCLHLDQTPSWLPMRGGSTRFGRFSESKRLELMRRLDRLNEQVKDAKKANKPKGFPSNTVRYMSRRRVQYQNKLFSTWVNVPLPESLILDNTPLLTSGSEATASKPREVSPTLKVLVVDSKGSFEPKAIQYVVSDPGATTTIEKLEVKASLDKLLGTVATVVSADKKITFTFTPEAPLAYVKETVQLSFTISYKKPKADGTEPENVSYKTSSTALAVHRQEGATTVTLTPLESTTGKATGYKAELGGGSSEQGQAAAIGLIKSALDASRNTGEDVKVDVNVNATETK